MAKVPVVDKQTCIGCGTCVSIAGKTFKLNNEGKSEVILPPGDEEAKIQEAVDCCPVSVISWSQ
jgi:ferredoxin